MALVDMPLILACEKLSEGPDVVCDASFHRRSHAQALVYPAEVVISEVQYASGLVIANSSVPVACCPARSRVTGAAATARR